MPMNSPAVAPNLLEAFSALSALVDGGWESAGTGAPGPWVAEEPIGNDRLRLAVCGSTRHLQSQAHGFKLTYRQTGEDKGEVLLENGTLADVRACLEKTGIGP